MKKLFLSALIFALGFNCMAQEHLKYKGLEINGSISEFCQKLQESGFQTINQKPKLIEMKGNFSNLENCDVALVGLEKEDLIYKVVTVSKQYSSVSQALTDYQTLNKNLMLKYANYTDINFDTLGISDISMAKFMSDIHNDKRKINAFYQDKRGFIEISMREIDLQPIIVVIYIDKKNNNKKLKEEYEDL